MWRFCFLVTFFRRLNVPRTNGSEHNYIGDRIPTTRNKTDVDTHIYVLFVSDGMRKRPLSLKLQTHELIYSWGCKTMVTEVKNITFAFHNWVKSDFLHTRVRSSYLRSWLSYKGNEVASSCFTDNNKILQSPIRFPGVVIKEYINRLSQNSSQEWNSESILVTLTFLNKNYSSQTQRVKDFFLNMEFLLLTLIYTVFSLHIMSNKKCNNIHLTRDLSRKSFERNPVGAGLYEELICTEALQWTGIICFEKSVCTVTAKIVT